MKAPTSATYQPRTAEQGVLYQIVREHLETFLHEAAQRAEGAGLPDFVEQEWSCPEYLSGSGS